MKSGLLCDPGADQREVFVQRGLFAIEHDERFEHCEVLESISIKSSCILSPVVMHDEYHNSCVVLKSLSMESSCIAAVLLLERK